MKAIWLACCACGDYGLLQREVEGRDAGAQVLRVGDLDGLISMARAFPSRRGAAIIAASLFDTEDVRKTVARLTAEGRVSRVVVLIEALDPSDIEGLFRAGATEVIAVRSICGNGRAGEGTVLARAPAVAACAGGSSVRSLTSTTTRRNPGVLASTCSSCRQPLFCATKLRRSISTTSLVRTSASGKPASESALPAFWEGSLVLSLPPAN